MLMKVESCCESWLLHLDVTSLNRGKKKKKKWIYYQYFPSPCCTIRPTQPVWVHNNCTIKKKLLAGRKKKKKSTGVWMWALQLPAWREAKGNCAATNSSLIKKSQWPHWITLTHPQKLMLSLQPFYESKKSQRLWLHKLIALLCGNTKKKNGKECGQRSGCRTELPHNQKGNSITWLNA